ncbi:MAG: ParB N-terminal domain-containing protein [FCB group bacterium]|jgi:hypothetical protein|nr:ParB N-terminal domain-containing protein [FCB group bacterium]
MNTPLDINGIDIPLASLKTLADRESVNPKTHKGYMRIRASIRAVGLIEPLSVYAEDGSYVILDGHLRLLACRELGIKSVPCIVYPEKDAYTFNRMVNSLSGCQEMRMLRKSLETLDEKTIAGVFGMHSIRHRLAPTLMAQLHQKVAEAFEVDLIGRLTATEMTCVKPERQFEILSDMKRVNDFSPAFVRALILKTAPEQRNPKRSPTRRWSEDRAKRKDLVQRLENAERQHEFYTRLYRQYSADLLKLALYVRKLITTQDVNDYLKAHHKATLNELSAVVMDTPVGIPVDETE